MTAGLLSILLSLMARRGRTIGVFGYTTGIPGGFWIKNDGKIIARFEWRDRAYRKEKRS